MADVALISGDEWVPVPAKFESICAAFTAAFGEPNTVYALFDDGNELGVRLMKPGRCWITHLNGDERWADELYSARIWWDHHADDQKPNGNIAAINWSLTASKKAAADIASGNP